MNDIMGISSGYSDIMAFLEDVKKEQESLRTMFVNDVKRAKQERTDFYLELKVVHAKHEDITDKIDLCKAIIDVIKE